MRLAKPSMTALTLLAAVCLPIGIRAQATQAAQQVKSQAERARSTVQGNPPAEASPAPKGTETEAAARRRDPFRPLVGEPQQGGGGFPQHLPPGKAGLVVGTLHIEGLVRGPNGMIAVVGNPQDRVYFLREGDELYNGRVERITMDEVVFHETGKDAFGKPVERQVIKRLYSSAGEQQ